MADRLKINRAALDALTSGPQSLALALGSAKAIADACNAESSWGGYEFDGEVGPDGAEARVFSIGENDDDARRDRMVRNLDAGR